MSQKLKLRFNSKSEILWLDSDKDLNKLLGIINKVSEDYIEVDDDDKDKPQVKISKIAKALRTIRSKPLIEIFTSEHKNLQHTLRYAFDKAVNQVLDSQPNELAKIELELEKLDFNYVRYYPQTITLLITKISKIAGEYKKFLLKKKTLTTFDIDLIVNYLCQTDFSDKTLVKVLENSEIKSIILCFNDKKNIVDNCNTGYYETDFSKVIPLLKEVSLSEQIRLRAYSEQSNNYSVALNNLLNELQLICFLVDKTSRVDIKKYDSDKVKVFLTSKGVDTNLCNDISNLFDRRNINPISHPGNDIRFAKLVQKDEYNKYKEKVSTAITRILN